MIRNYLKAALWEYPLCTACSAALVWILTQGFFLPEGLDRPAPVIALALGLQALLFLSAYSRRTAAAGICCGCAALVLLLIWARSAPEGVPFWLVLNLIPSAAVFLLSRSRIGCCLLFPLGTLLCACFAFLEYVSTPAALLVFLWAALALFGCRAYRRSVMTGSAARTSFPAAFFTSALAAALALCLALSAYVAVIRPLQPPTRELKLMTRLMSLEVLERIGVSTQVHLFDEEKLSQDTGDEERISPDEGENPQQGPGEDTPESMPSPDGGEDSRQNQGNGPDGDTASAIRYQSRSFLLLAIPLLVALFIAATILGKRLTRRLWRLRLERREPGEQVCLLYDAMLRKLRCLGLPPGSTDTPYEYVIRTEAQTARLLGKENGFSALTEVCVRVRYGALPPEPEELRRCWTFYDEFYSRCRRSLGGLRYALYFFRI